MSHFFSAPTPLMDVIAGFCQKPEWRWLRAQDTADPRLDDDWVVKARAACEKIASSIPWDHREPAIAAAQALWSTESSRRWMTEAYLLTPMPIAEVSKHCGLSAAALTAYHALFFDVRDRGTATDWLSARAVKFDQPGGLLRYAAFAGGVLPLQMVIAVTTNAPFPRSVRESFLHPEIEESRLRLRVILAMKSWTASTAPDWADARRIRRLIRVHDPDHALEKSEEQCLERQAKLLAQTLRPRRKNPAPSRHVPRPPAEARSPKIAFAEVLKGQIAEATEILQATAARSTGSDVDPHHEEGLDWRAHSADDGLAQRLARGKDS
jgi:hypothetical protein